MNGREKLKLEKVYINGDNKQQIIVPKYTNKMKKKRPLMAKFKLLAKKMFGKIKYYYLLVLRKRN